MVLLQRVGEVALKKKKPKQTRAEKLSFQLVSSLSSTVRPSALFYASVVLVQLMSPSPVYGDLCAAIIFAWQLLWVLFERQC